LTLKQGHPDLRIAGLDRFAARVTAKCEENDRVRLKLDCTESLQDKIASVEFWGRYRGYDENGDGNDEDWHGFTKDLRPIGIIAAANSAPFEAAWDLSMIPESDDLAVRAVVRFRELPDVVYITPPTQGPRMPEREARVELIYSDDLPRPFWSRADRKKKCALVLGDDPARIERAQLHITVWDGGRGEIVNPLSFNGKALSTPRWRGRHDLLYTVIELDPSDLREGVNEVMVHSDTDHHGIEVCLPGPALVVRVRESAALERE
jgi:hypothetical protein